MFIAARVLLAQLQSGHLLPPSPPAARQPDVLEVDCGGLTSNCRGPVEPLSDRTFIDEVWSRPDLLDGCLPCPESPTQALCT